MYLFKNTCRFKNFLKKYFYFQLCAYSNPWPFFTNYHCKHICAGISISKYNVLSLYNIACMCVFKNNILALSNQGFCSSLGKHHLSHIYLSSLACSFLLHRFESCWTFLRVLWHICWGHLYSLHVWAVMMVGVCW